MSAFKGTPGPWKVRGEESVVVETLAYCATVMPADNVYRGNITYIQSCNYLGPHAIGRAEARANAHLIAASPDLLGQHEADMVDLDLLAKAIHAGDPMPELVIRVTDMLNRKRAAIAKATGEQP